MDDVNHLGVLCCEFSAFTFVYGNFRQVFIFVYACVHHVNHYTSTLMLCKSDMPVLHMQWWEVF